MLDDAAHKAWVAQLSKMEAEVAEARETIESGEIPPQNQSWKPPQLSKLPADLQERATKLQSDLEELRSDVRVAMDRNREERDRLRSTPQSKKRESKPIYLDIEG